MAQTISTKFNQSENIRIQVRCDRDVIGPREMRAVDCTSAHRQISEQNENLDYRAPKECVPRLNNRAEHIGSQKLLDSHQFEGYLWSLPPITAFFLGTQFRHNPQVIRYPTDKAIPKPVPRAS
ncbi:MAG: hypothetical protein QOI07_486 [Verrucomicrobiota bacterium]